MLAGSVGVLVSIHAPVMDAKSTNSLSLSVSVVSIHAPVMDANNMAGRINIAVGVSIHAPVMDANLAARQLVCIPCFNPRARDGRE